MTPSQEGRSPETKLARALKGTSALQNREHTDVEAAQCVCCVRAARADQDRRPAVSGVSTAAEEELLQRPRRAVAGRWPQERGERGQTWRPLIRAAEGAQIHRPVKRLAFALGEKERVQFGGEAWYVLKDMRVCNLGL